VKNSADTDDDPSLSAARRLAAWLFVAGIFVLGSLAFILIASIFVVLLFRVVAGGQISVSLLGLKFEGASGPVIMWAICFLAIVLAFYMLWDKTYTGPVSGTIFQLHPSPQAGKPC